jgi:hypothetical protein
VDLEFFQQDPALQKQLEAAANKAIEKAFEELKSTDVSQIIDARLARPSDELEIRKLFDRYPMRMPGFDLIYDRSPDFFSLLRARGSASVALTGGLKGSSELMGLGALSVRDGFINGRRTRVAYLGDLRVIPHRKTFRLWRSMYSHLIEEVARELKVESFLTAILGDNLMALKSLVERRNSGFRYESIGQLQMINIFGAFAPVSFARSVGGLQSPSSYRGERVSEDEFSAFYEKEAANLRHGLVQAPNSGRPILVRDGTGKVLLGARLLTPDREKRMRVENTGMKMRLLLKAVGLSKGSSLSTGYLSYVTFAHGSSPVERRLGLAELVSTCYREKELGNFLSARSMLVVPDSVGLSVRELGGRFHQSTKVELFEVTSTGPGPGGQASIQDVAFDMALV